MDKPIVNPEYIAVLLDMWLEGLITNTNLSKVACYIENKIYDGKFVASSIARMAIEDATFAATPIEKGGLEKDEARRIAALLRKSNEQDNVG